MKLSIALSALLITGFVAASTEKASAVVYCQYVEYPVGCVARAGVVLRPRPVAGGSTAGSSATATTWPSASSYATAAQAGAPRCRSRPGS